MSEGREVPIAYGANRMLARLLWSGLFSGPDEDEPKAKPEPEPAIDAYFRKYSRVYDPEANARATEEKEAAARRRKLMNEDAKKR